MLQARIKSPFMLVPGTLEALQKLGAAVGKAGIPKTTHYLMHVRASQINGCSVCTKGARCQAFTFVSNVHPPESCVALP